MPDGAINIDSVLGTRASVSISASETPEELAARLQQEKWDAIYAQVKNYIVLLLVIVGVVVISGFCAHLIFIDQTSSPETKKWAQTVLSSILTGSISFLLGQATAKKSK